MVGVVKDSSEVVLRIQREIKESKELQALQEWREEEMDLRKQQQLLEEENRVKEEMEL